MVVRLPWLGRHPARLAACVILALLAVMPVLAIAAPLGVVSAVRPRSWIARMVTGYNTLAMAVPTLGAAGRLEREHSMAPAVPVRIAIGQFMEESNTFVRAVLGPGRGDGGNGR